MRPSSGPLGPGISTGVMRISSATLVSQRLAGLQRLRDALERFLLAAKAEKRLALEVEKMIFADFCRRWQRPAGEHPGQLAADERIVIADPSGPMCQVDT